MRAPSTAASRGAGHGLSMLTGCLAACFALALGAAGLTQALRAGPLATITAPAALLEAAYATLSLELEARLETREPGAGALVALGPAGGDVRLSGELDEGAADRLRALLDAHPEVARIHLTSEGGLVEEGQAIGDLVAERGLVTYVPDYCVSACTLAFVRGRERLIVAQARLGFHAPYEPGLFGRDFQADSAPERALYLRAGLAPDFVDAALATASSDIWIPDPERMRAAGVITGVVDTGRFPDSTLDGSADPAHARSAVLRNLPLLAGFEARAPGVVDALAADYLDAYRAGRSEAEGFAGIRRGAAEAVARAMRGADDATLVALARTLARAMERVHDGDGAPADRAETCAALSTAGGLVRVSSIPGADAPAGPAALVGRAVGGGSRRGEWVGEARASGIWAIEDDARSSAGSVAAPAAGHGCSARRARYAAALARPDPAAALRPLLFPAPPHPAREASARP